MSVHDTACTDSVFLKNKNYPGIFMVCETGIFLLRLISLSKTEKQEKVRILKFSTHLWQLNKSVTENMMISPF